GFPTGARIAGELVRARHITVEEGNYLLGFCNNVSPAFLIGFCMTKSLGRPELTLPALLLSFGAPILTGLLTRRGRSFPSLAAEKKTSGSQISFKIADACIMNGLESILKLGCYMILFSMLARLLRGVPCPYPALTCALVGILEITNGISLTAASALPARLSFSLTLGIAAFGGLSGLAQTQSMIQDSGLSSASYLRAKSLTAVLVTASAFFTARFIL
ncbi:MAG: transporter, partial [Candidatus Merdisoma sp.]